MRVLASLCPGCDRPVTPSDVLCPQCGLVQVPQDPFEVFAGHTVEGRQWGARARSAKAGLPAAGAGSLASIPRRCAAAAIDLLVLLPLWTLALLSEGSVRVLGVLGALVGCVLYEVVALRVRGATLGRAICGVRVVPVAGVGAELARDARGWPAACGAPLHSLQISWGRAFARGASSWGLRVIGSVAPGLGGLVVGDGCWILIHPWQQSWHDLIGATVVVRTRSPAL